MDVENNEAAKELTKDRLGKWLSVVEERNLRNGHIDYVTDVLNKWATDKKRLNPNASEVKKAMALGMLYRGDGINSILDNHALLDTYNNGTDRDFENAVFDFYGDSTYNDANGKTHYKPERARMHKEFIDNYLQRQEEKRLQELQEQQ